VLSVIKLDVRDDNNGIKLVDIIYCIL